MTKYTQSILKYGTIPSSAHVKAGGSGNTLDHFHGIVNNEAPGLSIDALRSIFFGANLSDIIKQATTPIVTDFAGQKVHYRQGADIAPVDADGDEYHFVGGFQPGVANRLNFNVDIVFQDHDGIVGRGDMFGADMDTSEGVDMAWWVMNWSTMTATAERNGETHTLQFTGNGAEPGNTAWESFNFAFVLDWMYDGDTGQAWNGTDAADLYTSVKTIDEGLKYLPEWGATTMESRIHIVTDDPFAVA